MTGTFATVTEINNPIGFVYTLTYGATGLDVQFKFPTTTTLSSSVNPSAFGQGVMFTATVSSSDGSPTGIVTFTEGTSSLGTGTLNGSDVATFGTSTLAPGSHTITAVYGSDPIFGGSTSGPFVQTVSYLQVATFTPTSTGFSAVFNTPLNLGTALAPILNLYDNSTGTLGPANVTLVGSSTGAIRGSLVVDAVAGRSGSDGNTRITFIQTGQSGVLGSAAAGTLFGVLPDGTYTVTLRSATDGFQDTNGNLLDGNGDGTAGDNFVTTFVVNNPSNAVVVSLPDFARGPGQAVNGTDGTEGTEGIPLRVLNDGSTAVTVTSVTLKLVYDPSLLTISNMPGAVDTTSTPGVAIVTYSSTGLILDPGGDAIFANLTAAVPSTAGYGEKEILDLQNININNGSFTSGNGLAIDDDAVHVSGFLGDVTGDGIYTGLDAQRISRVAVGLDPGFRQWVLADPLIVGDVSGDNVLTGLDALQIARQAVGITQGNVLVLPTVTPAITGPDPVVSIPTDFTAKPQAGVVVPVNLDPGANAPRLAGLDSVNLVIAYDTSRVDVVSAADVVRGSLTQSFDNFTVNVDRAAGIIYISGYRGLVSGGVVSGGLVSGGVVSGEWSGGSLALISFQVRADAPAGAAVINLMQNAGSAWTALGGTDGQGNDFLFDLESRPSNVAGDVLDGSIDVSDAPRSPAGRG